MFRPGPSDKTCKAAASRGMKGRRVSSGFRQKNQRGGAGLEVEDITPPASLAGVSRVML